MSIRDKNRLFTDSYNQDDNYKDVLSVLSQLDDKADIDYVKENYQYEQKCTSRHPRLDFHPLQNAAKFFQLLIQKRCA